VRVVVAGDALVNAVIRSAAKRFKVPVVAMVHGLDITFANPLYRRVAIPALRSAPRVLSNSRATADLAISQGVQPDRIRVIRLAVDPVKASANTRAAERESLGTTLGVDREASILVTVGRLVERKGVRWFVREVLPHLPETVHYAIAGSGPEAKAIEEAAAATGVDERVHLLGRVSDPERERLLRGGDLFIQANIPVENDIEGFGLVAVEAALRGTPVLASDLEGLRDAVTDGETGTLLPAGDVQLWAATVTRLLADREALSRTGERAAELASVLYNQATLQADLAKALEV
jgi:phosphatidylinositol alpha-1,6-mannosyltransferase